MGNVNVLDNEPPYVQGYNGQVLTCSGGNANGVVWIVPNIIWTGIGGGVQVITSAPQIQLDLPGVPEAVPEKKADGATCKRCEDFNEFAEPNQPDDTFLCYRCRHNL